MKSSRNWIIFLLLGTLWGAMEVFGGEFLYANDVARSSVWLTAWAFFIMAMGRGLVNVSGSSSVIGAVAALFKLVNASPYYCHLLGIFFLGVFFDVAASYLMKKGRISTLRSSLSGIIGVYGGYALFALVITFIARYEPWVAGGWPKVLDHIFMGGSIAAIAAAVLVPFGYKAGVSGETFTSRNPRWAYAGASLVLVALWILGRIAG